LVEVPSIFSKPDFLGVLLPGYIAVILTIVLIFPDLVPVQNNQGLSFDFFSAVVFIVAGPAIGYTLRQLHRILYTVISLGTLEKKEKRKQAIEQYYALRIAIGDPEKMELDMSEGQYDFNISTGIVLLLISLYLWLNNPSSLPWLSILMMVMSGILFVGGFLERKEGFIPLYKKLVQKYSKLM